MKICPACNHQFEDTLKFCPNDGTALASPDTVPSTLPNNPKETDSLAGKLIAGRYQILARLGEGGMGAVYKAEQTMMNRTCAIKIMNPAYTQDHDAVSRFHREAQMSSKLDHPHAIHIYDFGNTEDGLLYLVMEFVEGQTLSSLLKQSGPLSLERTMTIARQAAAALEAAHKLNIVHRDLKPDNIMIAHRDNSDWVKVLDFGIAKVSGEDHRWDVTKAGMVIGTPLYMSPEQLSGDRLDPRSDIYSFALIIYQMLTGGLPFTGDNAQAVMVKRLTETPLPMATVNPRVSISATVENAIMQGLARNRDHRPYDVGTFLQLLEQAIRTTSPSAFAGTIQYVAQRGDTNPISPAATHVTGAKGPSAPASSSAPAPSPTPPTPGQPQPPVQPIGSNSAMPPIPTIPQPQGTPGQAFGAPPVPPGFGYQPGPQPGQGVGVPQSGVPQPPPSPPPPAPRKSYAGLIIGLVLVFAVLGVGGVWGIWQFVLKKDTPPVVTTDPKQPEKKPDSSSGDSKPATTTPTDPTVTTEPETPTVTANPIAGDEAAAKASYDEGLKLAKENKLSEAIVKFQEAVKAKPDYGEAHLALGTGLFALHQIPESINAYTQAIRYVTDADKKHKAHYGRGLGQWESQAFTEAAQDFKTAYENKPTEQELLVYQGFMLQLAGNTDEANTAYDTYLQSNKIGKFARYARLCRSGKARPPATLKEFDSYPLD